MRIFGGGRISGMMQALNIPEDQPIESGLVTKALVSAQKKVEGLNFDARKHLLDYDDILNKQRVFVYNRRQRLLEAGREELKEIIAGIIETKGEGREEEKNQIKALIQKTENIEVFRYPLLAMLDTLWMTHLEDLESLRESVRIRAYGQHDPLVEYRRESHILYRKLLEAFDAWVYDNLSKIKIVPQEQVRPQISQEVRAAELNMRPEEFSEIGRNDPCPCGSGKKFKKCHGA